MAYQKVAFEPPFHLLFALLSLEHIVAELACPHVFAVIQVGGYRPGLIFDFGRTVWIAGERLGGGRFGALGDFAGGLEGVRKKGQEEEKQAYAPLSWWLVVDIVVVCSAAFLGAGQVVVVAGIVGRRGKSMVSVMDDGYGRDEGERRRGCRPTWRAVRRHIVVEDSAEGHDGREEQGGFKLCDRLLIYLRYASSPV